jgi:antitoxin HicB
VLTLTLEGRYDEKLHIPLPSKRVKGAYWIAPALRVQSAFLLKFARHKKTLAELARALETSWPAVARLENPRHTPNLRQLEKAAAALGKQIVIDFIDED